MRIGINGQRMLMEQPAGPEVYTINLVKGLAQTDKVNEYVIYFPSEPSQEFWISLIGNNERFKFKVIKKKISWTQISLAYELIRHPPDIFFTSVHTMPVIRRFSLKTIGMIHGLEYPFSKAYRNLIQRMLLGKPEQYVVKFSKAVIVPSNHVKEAILAKNWTGDDKKVRVIPEGVSSDFHKYSDEEINAMKVKYHVDKDYLIFISTIQPRKNLPKLVEAFALALKEIGETDIKLAVVGKLGWDYEESLASPKNFGVEKEVLFLGRVDDKDLPVLLSGSRGYVSVSFDEGFGLPLLEAMASGVPAIVSDIRAYRELAGEFVWYADPFNVEDIKDKLIRLIKGGYPLESISRAGEVAKQYDWERAAVETVKVFIEVCGGTE